MKPKEKTMAGQTGTQEAFADFISSDNGQTKKANVGNITFNDAKGPRQFVTNLTIGMFIINGATKINIDFDTNGELGGGIDNGAALPVEILSNDGVVIYSVESVPFNGPCRNGLHHNTATRDLPVEVFNLAGKIRIPNFTVNIYAC